MLFPAFQSGEAAGTRAISVSPGLHLSSLGVRARHVRAGRLSWVRGACTTTRSGKILNLLPGRSMRYRSATAFSGACVLGRTY
jgi:hypothetical protein